VRRGLPRAIQSSSCTPPNRLFEALSHNITRAHWVRNHLERSISIRSNQNNPPPFDRKRFSSRERRFLSSFARGFFSRQLRLAIRSHTGVGGGRFPTRSPSARLKGPTTALSPQREKRVMANTGSAPHNQGVFSRLTLYYSDISSFLTHKPRFAFLDFRYIVFFSARTSQKKPHWGIFSSTKSTCFKTDLPHKKGRDTLLHPFFPLMISGIGITSHTLPIRAAESMRSYSRSIHGSANLSLALDHCFSRKTREAKRSSFPFPPLLERKE